MAPIIGTDALGRRTYTFIYTGTAETWTVPDGVKKIKIEAWGAQGPSVLESATAGGKGGYAVGEYVPSAGQVLNIFVGGMLTGFNGGGGKRSGTGSNTNGGGASDVRAGGTTLSNRIIVAGGGGGGYGNAEPWGKGGDGGGLTGADGAFNYIKATGGTQSNGGQGGSNANDTGSDGLPGTLGVGGASGTQGGGGGGGYYGGGGGNVGGGGGGSSYIGTLTNASTTPGLRSGDGLVVITLFNTPPSLTLTSPSNNQTIKQGTDIDFKWSGSDPDGDALTYTLQVGTSAGASNIYNASVGSATSKQGISTSWVVGLYYWRVVANDGKGGVTTSAEGVFGLAQGNLVTISSSNAVSRNTGISSAAPDSNYSYNTVFGVSSGVLRGLLAFDLGLIPNNAIINSATLKLMQDSGVATDIGVHRILSSWVESSVTWNSQPTFDSNPSVTFAFTTSAKTHNIDLRELVQQWVAGDINNGILLKVANESITNVGGQFKSIRATTVSERPTLTIDYSIPTTGKKQVEYIDVTNVASATGSTSLVLPTIPARAQVGDILVAMVGHRAQSQVINPPSGWTRRAGITSGGRFDIFTKTMELGDSTFQFTTSSSTQWFGCMAAFRNVKSVLLANANNALNGSTALNPPATSTTVQKTVFLLLNVLFGENRTFTPPLGYQEIIDSLAGNSSGLIESSFRYMHSDLDQTTTEMTSICSAAPVNQSISAVLVLEPVVNSVPTLTLTSPANNQTLAEGSTYKLEGIVSDADVGNVLSVKYSIAGGPTQSIPAGTIDGVNPLSFSKMLTYSQGRFWEGQTEVSGLLPTETTSIQVWAYDGLDDSAMVTRNFTIQQEDGKLYVPVNVVSSAFLVSKMARPVRLRNGWLVGAVHQSGTAIRVYKSQNNGITWIALADVTNANPVKFALTCKGTRVYVLTLYNSYTSIVHFDAIAPHNQLVTTVDTLQAPSGGGSIFITPDGTNLWWATSGTTAIYPYSTNIRTGSVPILQDGTLGKPSTVHQLGIQNNSSSNLKNPTVATLPNGSPCIIVDWTNASTSLIFGYYWNGSAFGSKSIFTTNVPQTQSSPDVCTTPNGKLHVAWHGTDSSDTVNPWIRYSNSVEGASWLPTPKKLVTGRNASITSDKNGKLIITYEDNGYIKRIESSNEFTSFSGPFVDDIGTNPATCYDQSFQTDFSIPPTFYQAAGTVKYRGLLNLNKRPVVTLDTQDNQTLTENSTLMLSGQAVDEDVGNIVSVFYKINNGPTQAAASGISDGSTPILFDKALTYKNKRIYLGTTDLTGVDLSEDTEHYLTVWAEDNKQGKSLEVVRKYRVLHNQAPVIDGEEKDLGLFMQPPTVNYSATDPEANTFTFTEYLNGKQIRSFTGVAGQQYTVEISHDAWIRLDLDMQHQIKIVATDSAGISSERVYTFTRTETHIEFMLEYGNPDIKADFTLDGMPLRVLVTLERYLPEGSSIESVKVCNNYLDDVPTWEDCTGAVKGNRGYLFTNKVKTAPEWAINLWVTINKGTARERVLINGYGGAFD
ncbi:DNRLRE domain-containing protein [Brevibacillus porteri]|uniref:DNRLRE domain-containing protein n=1 Tax=Brevibacillus porteri TaxID=2126350 RepID=UPI0036416311